MVSMVMDNEFESIANEQGPFVSSSPLPSHGHQADSIFGVRLGLGAKDQVNSIGLGLQTSGCIITAIRDDKEKSVSNADHRIAHDTRPPFLSASLDLLSHPFRVVQPTVERTN